MYYAQLDTGESLDLWRFKTKQERDGFVVDSPSCAMAMLAKEAKEIHKEQFKYWRNNDQI